VTPLGSVIGWKSSHAKSAVLETVVSRIDSYNVANVAETSGVRGPSRGGGGPCIAKVVDDDAEGGTRECGRSVSSCWYVKGKLYCASHRTAWNKSKALADDAEEPSYLDDMTEVIGTRYCEPSKMKPAEKYNSIKKTSLKELQKSFKRDAKRFKTAAQLARE
jgi:hypothetical protein